MAGRSLQTCRCVCVEGKGKSQNWGQTPGGMLGAWGVLTGCRALTVLRSVLAAPYLPKSLTVIMSWDAYYKERQSQTS